MGIFAGFAQKRDGGEQGHIHITTLALFCGLQNANALQINANQRTETTLAVGKEHEASRSTMQIAGN